MMDMSKQVRLHIKGMTCAHCESSVASALEEVGAREVHVDHRRAEAVFTAPVATDLTPYREALSRAGYQAASEEVLPAGIHPVPTAAHPRDGQMGWLGTAALVSLPLLCCGLPLLAGVLFATGAGAWLVANRSLLAVPFLAVAIVGVMVWRGARKRSS